MLKITATEAKQIEEANREANRLKELEREKIRERSRLVADEENLQQAFGLCKTIVEMAAKCSKNSCHFYWQFPSKEIKQKFVDELTKAGFWCRIVPCPTTYSIEIDW